MGGINLNTSYLSHVSFGNIYYYYHRGNSGKDVYKCVLLKKINIYYIYALHSTITIVYSISIIIKQLLQTVSVRLQIKSPSCIQALSLVFAYLSFIRCIFSHTTNNNLLHFGQKYLLWYWLILLQLVPKYGNDTEIWLTTNTVVQTSCVH